MGPENSPETKDFTDPWGGGLNPHAPRVRLWFLYLYMSFYTSDHNRRKSLRIPDIMVCISREQYNRSLNCLPPRRFKFWIIDSKLEMHDILISGSRSEPAVDSSATSQIHKIRSMVIFYVILA